MTCRCIICGRNDAGSNRHCTSYIRAGIKYSEDGYSVFGKDGKRFVRKMRRRIEKREWQREILNAY